MSMSFKIVKHSWMTCIILTLSTGEQCFPEVFTSWHPLNWHRHKNLSLFQSLNTARKISPACVWSLSSVFACWRFQVSISQFWGLNIGQWVPAREPRLKITSLQREKNFISIDKLKKKEIALYWWFPVNLTELWGEEQNLYCLLNKN